MRKNVLRTLTLSVLYFLVMVCLSAKPVHAASSDDYLASILEQAISSADTSYSVNYGPFASAEDAAGYAANLMARIDTPYYFMQNACYIENRTVFSAGAYRVISSVRKYRDTDLDAVDWTGIADSFGIDGRSDLYKALYVHEWLCGRMEYSTEPSRTLSTCLDRGLAKCDEYSIIYAKLMQSLGVECRCIDGVASGTYDGHMWNLMRIGEKWYFCDVMADDDEDSFNCFLKGTDDPRFLADHEIFLDGYRLCNGISDFASYNISSKNYFYYQQQASASVVKLDQLKGVSTKNAKKATCNFIVTGDGGYTYSAKHCKINTRGIDGCIFGKIPVGKSLRRFLIWL